jgi:hypothetical protein
MTPFNLVTSNWLSKLNYVSRLDAEGVVFGVGNRNEKMGMGIMGMGIMGMKIMGMGTMGTGTMGTKIMGMKIIGFWWEWYWCWWCGL